MAEYDRSVGHDLGLTDGVNGDRYRRSSLSVAHVLSAAVLARQTREIEDEAVAAAWKGQHDEQRAFATATVVMSAAFLEALVNEVIDCLRDEERAEVFAPFTKAQIMQARALHGRAKGGDAESAVVGKYHCLFEAFKKKADAALEVDAELIIELRNKLMHAFPVDSVLSSEGTVKIASAHGSLEARLQDLVKRRGVELNPLWKDAVLFPNGILGAGLARWAFASARDYADSFFRELGITPLYEHVRAQL